MKAFIAAIAIGSIAMPAAAAGPLGLAGVSDRETTIPSGGISAYYYGKGDVLFVRDQAARWYRLGLNKGCLGTPVTNDGVVFEGDGVTGRIDTFTQVRFINDRRVCRVDSIRRSVAPPQVDSDSPITLD